MAAFLFFPERKMTSAAKTTNCGNNMETQKQHLAVCQNLVPLVNIKIAGKWMFIPLKWY